MKTIRHLLVMLLCFSLCAPLALAKPLTDKQQDIQANRQDVLIIIQQDQVRFTAQKSVAEMQLQIFDQTGQLVYDSGAVAEQELAWALRHVNGEAIKSGLYAYALSMKEAGAETAKVRRGHFIVDRAKERDAETDRLWVTSQNDSAVGTELTVARNEGGTIAGASITSELKSAKTQDGTARDDEAESKKEDKASLAGVGFGTPGRIAKFTSSTNIGNSVMTELNGGIGVGITNPLSKLHIASGFNEILPPRAQTADSKSFAAGWDFYHGTTGKGYVGVPGTSVGIAPGEMLVFGAVNTPTSIWAGGRRAITVNTGGYVGIGTANPIMAFPLQVVDEQTTNLFSGAVIGASINNNGVVGQSEKGVGVTGMAGPDGTAGYFFGKVSVQGDLFPTYDGYRLGTPTRRWTAVYAVNGTIQTSDARLKQGITNLRYGLSELMQLRPVSFQWKDDSNGQQHLGFIAQETQQVIPEAVTQPTDADSPMGMNYSTLIPVVIKSIQEQQSEMTTLKDQNESLQQRNATLQQQNTDLDLRLKSLEKTVRQLTGQSKAKTKRHTVR